MKKNNRELFESIVSDLLSDPDVISMQDLEHHGDISCFDHSYFVAYLSFLAARRMGMDYRAAARGGLLHDLYLCNWEDENIGLSRLWSHPKRALKNAEDRFELNPLEKDIIEKHMWPLTLSAMPKHRESFVVSLADKVCAVAEFSRVYSVFSLKKRLTPAAAKA